MTDYILPPIACQPVDYQAHLALYPCFIQPKYNGVRCLLGPDGRAWSKHCRIYPGFKGQFIQATRWLDGEVIDRRWFNNDPRAMTLQTIAGLANNHEPDEELMDHLVFVAFDLISQDSQRKRLEWLAGVGPLVPMDGLTKMRATTTFVHNQAHAEELYAGMPKHVEGVVYRQLEAVYQHGKTNKVLKRKRLHSNEYACLAVHEGKGKYTGMFGGATLQLPNGLTFNCGGGYLTIKDRQQLFANPPIGKLVTVEYPYLSDEGRPLQAQFVAVRDYEK